MLRISTHENGGAVTFQLEGKLAGSWVQELHDCWEGLVAHGFAGGAPGGSVERPARARSAIRFNLTEVTYVDAAGKEFLAARYREGHELIAAGCLMKSVVAEITNNY